MPKLTVTIVLVGLVGLQVADAGIWDWFARSNDRLLENHFKQVIPNKNDPRKSMEVTQQLYRSDYRNSDSDFANFLRDVILLEAASSNCTYKHLKLAGDLASRYQVNLRHKNANKDKVQLMLHHYIAKLSSECEKAIVPKIDEVMAKVPQETLKLVREFGYDYAKRAENFPLIFRNPAKDPQETKRFLRNLYPKDRTIYGKILLKTISQLADQDPDRFALQDNMNQPQVLERLLLRYFLSPCKELLKFVNENTWDEYFWYLKGLDQTGWGSHWRQLTEDWMTFQVCKRRVGAGSDDIVAMLQEALAKPTQPDLVQK